MKAAKQNAGRRMVRFTHMMKHDEQAVGNKKQYFFNADGLFVINDIMQGAVFSCFAINDENAIRKFTDRKFTDRKQPQLRAR
jgi:hypothetical protein